MNKKSCHNCLFCTAEDCEYGYCSHEEICVELESEACKYHEYKTKDIDDE